MPKILGEASARNGDEITAAKFRTQEFRGKQLLGRMVEAPQFPPDVREELLRKQGER